MYLSYNPSSVAPIVYWVFAFECFPVVPLEKLSASYLYFASMAKKVDSVISLAQISLDSQPPIDTSFPSDYGFGQPT
jgi:hypothetical protein